MLLRRYLYISSKQEEKLLFLNGTDNSSKWLFPVICVGFATTLVYYTKNTTNIRES